MRYYRGLYVISLGILKTNNDDYHLEPCHCVTVSPRSEAACCRERVVQSWQALLERLFSTRFMVRLWFYMFLHGRTTLLSIWNCSMFADLRRPWKVGSSCISSKGPQLLVVMVVSSHPSLCVQCLDWSWLILAVMDIDLDAHCNPTVAVLIAARSRS